MTYCAVYRGGRRSSDSLTNSLRNGGSGRGLGGCRDERDAGKSEDRGSIRETHREESGRKNVIVNDQSAKECYCIWCTMGFFPVS